MTRATFASIQLEFYGRAAAEIEMVASALSSSEDLAAELRVIAQRIRKDAGLVLLQKESS